MNAAERAIQTFKDAFIAALTTTDSDVPLQLWDKITPQVQGTLNLMQASWINPAISTYKALNRLYDWNQYLLAPLGCKVVVYKDGDTRGSWALQGIDGWYLGPLMDHYSCDLYYIRDLVHIGKIRHIKNIKNLPPGAMYSSACCPALPRCFKSSGPLKNI
jgi:hypothetical protein